MKTKSQLITLKKAASLTNTVLKMIEDDRYCIDILQQINAVKGLLNSAANSIMENHLNHCFIEGMNSNDEKTKIKMIKEIQTIISKCN